MMLLPVSTSTKIFHEIIYQNAEIRFCKGRIKFLADGQENEKYKAGQMDSMIVIFRAKEEIKNWEILNYKNIKNKKHLVNNSLNLISIGG